MSTHLDTLVIGAGQAGLATAHQLRLLGRECLVIDAGSRIGDGWRHQWDSLRLYSPARYSGLPGMPFPASPWHYPTKDEVADYLEAYAARFDLPVRLRTMVLRVAQLPAGAAGAADAAGEDAGRFLVQTDAGDYVADNVVIATGTFGRTPKVPSFAADLDPSITQLHSSDYRRPAQLADGPVLVVGASHSGHDIAYEAALTRPTTLVGRDCGQIPVRLESRRMRVVFPVLWTVWGTLLDRRTPMGRKALRGIRFHGGPALRVKREDLLERGVERLEERVVGVEDGRPQLAGGRVLDVATVVWATGFRQAFGWLDVPVVGDDGWPREERGVATDVPGLYFVGLSMQSSFRSMLIGGVGADAAHVARHLARRATGRPVEPTAGRASAGPGAGEAPEAPTVAA
ncbi:MAG TPA: NAD(P)-binding domain-containing protein [Pedococcus sp.]